MTGSSPRGLCQRGAKSNHKSSNWVNLRDGSAPVPEPATLPKNNTLPWFAPFLTFPTTPTHNENNSTDVTT